MFGIDIVVFYCIARSDKLDLLESFNGTKQFDLYLCWKPVVHPIGIDHVSVEPFRLQPNLM